MHAAWTAFVKTGDPGWTRYALEQRATMVFDDQSVLKNDPMGAERAAWEGLR